MKKTPTTRLQVAKETGVLHVTINEDAEEMKLTKESMNLDDNTNYTAQKLKDAIKEEHDPL
eukprot:5094306-Amphidinium_carterae.2